MNIHLYGHNVTGGFLKETTPDTVDMDLERFVKDFQKDGYHVQSSGHPHSFDISRRDHDTLRLVAVLTVED